MTVLPQSADVDAIIVGQGLAGTALAWELHRRGRSFVIIDDAPENSSSGTAAGLITPITGKRLTLSPEFAAQLANASDFYAFAAGHTGENFFHQQPALRLFRHQDERRVLERRTRDAAFAEAVELWPSPSGNVESANDFIAPFGGFIMKTAARLDTQKYLAGSREYFVKNATVISERFDHGHVEWQTDRVVLRNQNLSARWIVFCEGYAAHRNPLFQHVVFDASRGDVLTLRIRGNSPRHVVHKDLWLVPLGDELFLAGSTYDQDFTDTLPRADARADIEARLRNLIRLPFEVVDHRAAVRPIVQGRQPIIGVHHEQTSAAILNGLGSHGSLLAPTLARDLADCLLDGKSPAAQYDVNQRFPTVHPSANSNNSKQTENPRPRLTTRAQDWLRPGIPPGGIAIDATAGNGHDTLFLAECVGPNGHVFAIDIQQRALDLTADRLAAAGCDHCTFIRGGHEDLRQHIPELHHGKIAAIMFNLGYLPGGNRRLITQAGTTRAALQASLELLAPGGMLTVLVYPMHPGGAEESRAVADWTASIHEKFANVQVANPDRADNAPVLYLVRRSDFPA